MKFAKGNQCREITLDDISVGMLLTVVKPRTYTPMNLGFGLGFGDTATATRQDRSYMGSLLRVKAISWPFVEVVVLDDWIMSTKRQECIDATQFTLGLMSREYARERIKVSRLRQKRLKRN